MTLLLIRSFYVFLAFLIGFYLGGVHDQVYVGAIVGGIAGLMVIILESKLRRVSVRGLSSMVFGLILGILMAKLLTSILTLLPMKLDIIATYEVVFTMIFSYLGAVVALRGKDEFNIIIPYVRFKRMEDKEGVVLVDTSAIIDGRIGEIYKTHFLAGRLVVIRSVLIELQALADSDNDIKRDRGRRGLDLIGTMQSDPAIDIHIHEDDTHEDWNVDTILMHLAKIMDGAICTTDYNLSRVAAVQGIKVLNINSLASSDKVILAAGDELSIKLIKEGKESHQAVGYLEDGTMVVVSDGKQLLGQTVDVQVTSILQTQAGKMVFARLGHSNEKA